MEKGLSPIPPAGIMLSFRLWAKALAWGKPGLFLIVPWQRPPWDRTERSWQGDSQHENLRPFRGSCGAWGSIRLLSSFTTFLPLQSQRQSPSGPNHGSWGLDRDLKQQKSVVCEHREGGGDSISNFDQSSEAPSGKTGLWPNYYPILWEAGAQEGLGELAVKLNSSH